MPAVKPSLEELLACYCPSKQVMYCRDKERALFGNAPTIRNLEAQFGFSTAVSWLEVQLNDLSEFAGCREKINPERCRELAGMMASDYPHYRLTEFMLFFQRFKRCHYGKFYGAVDPMTINGALLEFDRDRRRAIDRRREEDRKRKQKAEDDLWDQLRARYRARVPDAFTDKAPLDFNQYNILEFDSLSDGQMQWVVERIAAGQMKLPTDLEELVFYDKENLKEYIQTNVPE